MPSTKVVFAAALAGCMAITSFQASADETGVALGAVFRLPFSGGLEQDQKNAPRLGFGVSLRQDSMAGVRRFERRRVQLDIASIPFSGRSVDFSRTQFMGRDLFETRTVFNANGSGGSSEQVSKAGSNTILYGILGLAVIGGVVVASSGGDSGPDACIAIFPKPPGCP